MQRRLALKNIGALGLGFALFPACDFNQEKNVTALPGFNLSPAQLKLLKEVVSAILPAGVAGESLQLHAFVQLMVNDCCSEKEQAAFISGLEELEMEAQKQFSEPFTKLTSAEKEELLNRLLSGTGKSVHEFLKLSKQYAVMGFMYSEYVMTKEMPYNLVPGSYGHCETIEGSSKININA